MVIIHTYSDPATLAAYLGASGTQVFIFSL